MSGQPSTGFPPAATSKSATPQLKHLLRNTVLDVVQPPAGSVHPRRSWLMISTILPGTPLFGTGRGYRLRGASEHQVQRVCEYLRDWIAQLRNLQTPFEPRVCSFTGGSFQSLRTGEDPVIPCTCIAGFHIHESLTLPPSELASNPHLAYLVSARENKPYGTHLVHGDLLHNILTESDTRPTGIFDWGLQLLAILSRTCGLICGIYIHRPIPAPPSWLRIFIPHSNSLGSSCSFVQFKYTATQYTAALL
ncbi:hypothetical protein DFH08DRAFT_819902 [Mycena albidolilacea]|uniref:Aminoglycoside phosphotransferase domain-containing protein n=1 Tax=Mycena albidolilacea TaxID=1033008 RepID=A0AAD7EEZ9_9AGAR|nr:hypothetical protein DFH08DRAFT_819902 [Mycena albidolilacea]